jgi:hypothetical protein
LGCSTISLANNYPSLGRPFLLGGIRVSHKI